MPISLTQPPPATHPTNQYHPKLGGKDIFSSVDLTILKTGLVELSESYQQQGNNYKTKILEYV